MRSSIDIWREALARLDNLLEMPVVERESSLASLQHSHPEVCTQLRRLLRSEQAIRDSIPEFLLRLWNVYSFFTIYANIDGFDPASRLAGDAGQLDAAALAGGQGYRPLHERAEIDRWILAELHRTAAEVVERMDAYDNFAAAGRIAGRLGGSGTTMDDAPWSVDVELSAPVPAE